KRLLEIGLFSFRSNNPSKPIVLLLCALISLTISIKELHWCLSGPSFKYADKIGIIQVSQFHGNLDNGRIRMHQHSFGFKNDPICNNIRGSLIKNNLTDPV